VVALLKVKWSPKQIVGQMAAAGLLSMSYETIYRGVRQDKLDGGELWTHMRYMSTRVRQLTA
jgi:transposase, IS30 family